MTWHTNDCGRESGGEIGITCDRLYTDLKGEVVGESLPVDPKQWCLITCSPVGPL